MSQDSEPIQPVPEEDEREAERVSILANFEEDASPVLLGKIRNAIQRRTAVSQFASVYFALPPIVATEMSDMLVALFNSCIGRQEVKP